MTTGCNKKVFLGNFSGLINSLNYIDSLHGRIKMKRTKKKIPFFDFFFLKKKKKNFIIQFNSPTIRK